jgi:hypothetical protein
MHTRSVVNTGMPGYFRGSPPRFGGTGSMAGPGTTVPGKSVSSWSPTLANLLVLVVLEVVAFAALRYVFTKFA